MMEMLIRTDYPELDISLYSGVLPNGRRVFLVPTPHFREVHGLLTVVYGAMDTHYKKAEKEIHHPAGLAHFLEHKLFEKEEVGDLLQLFSQYGAEGNAFTSLTNTTYLFAASQYWRENTQLLHQLVCQPYFTDRSVRKEQDIIDQEIDLYADDPDYVLFSSLLSQLYPETPLAVDIAGTTASISQIDAAMLYQAHADFYHPSNQTLVLVGNIDAPEVWSTLLEVDTKSNPVNKSDNYCKPNRLPVGKGEVVSSGSKEMAISVPKFGIGFRGNGGLQGKSPFQYRLALSLFFSMLLGWTSKSHQTLYEEGRIDGGIDIQVEVHECFQYVLLTMDTSAPDDVRYRIHQILSGDNEDCTPEHFELLKREWYGDFLHQLDSPEEMAHQFVHQLTEGELLFETPRLLAELQFKTVMVIGREFLAQADQTDYQIFPKFPK